MISKQLKYSYNLDTLNLDRHRSITIQQDERSNDFFPLRNSLIANSLRTSNVMEPNSSKPLSFKLLRQTLDQLQDKVSVAKHQLLIPRGEEQLKKSLKGPNCQLIAQNDKQSRFGDNFKQNQRYSHLYKYNKQKSYNYRKTLHSSISTHKYYINELVRSINEKNSLAHDYLLNSIQMLKICQGYQQPTFDEIRHRKVHLKQHQFYKNKKTLIMDLDQTLIHCNENTDSESDFQLQMNLDGKKVKFGINIRPYALTFLKKMSSRFEIIVFTASDRRYADAILNQLDPDGQIFEHRLYRQHCVQLDENIYVKDMRILNRNIKSTILVDNSVYSFSFQLDNGIPILPFYEGQDSQLAKLQEYLMELMNYQDVRHLNRQTFRLNEYSRYVGGQQLIQSLYMNNFH